MKPLAKHDFVIVPEAEGKVPINAVGLVREINGSIASVFFIGISEEVTLPIESLYPFEVKKTGKGFPQ